MPTLHSPSVKNKQEDCAIMLNLDKPNEAGNHRNFDKDLPTLSQKQSKSNKDNASAHLKAVPKGAASAE